MPLVLCLINSLPERDAAGKRRQRDSIPTIRLSSMQNTVIQASPHHALLFVILYHQMAYDGYPSGGGTLLLRSHEEYMHRFTEDVISV
ncbi:hypothetical protein J2T58_002111 [Methanocalculus alkaliphilus]|nr:hypothetical protein [Methanocalculus alkaliphilus]